MKNKTDNSSIFVIAGIFVVSIIGLILLVANTNTSSGDGEIQNLQDWAKGASVEDAKITIVEYADFQCPGCKAAVPEVSKVAEEYGDSVRVIYKHYPIQGHAQAFRAAEAAEAAGAQGKFWEMQKLIFENQATLSNSSYVTFAQQLGLDVDRFEKELNEGLYEADVTADKNEADGLGVTGTPTFFINGELFNPRPGQVPVFEDFRTAIDLILSDMSEETTGTDNQADTSSSSVQNSTLPEEIE